jgi:hypothetical protein
MFAGTHTHGFNLDVEQGMSKKLAHMYTELYQLKSSTDLYLLDWLNAQYAILYFLIVL